MATPTHVSMVEQIIGYQFKNKSLLAQALTAAGAEEEDHEGNRRLALVGEKAIPFLISWGGYKKEGSPGKSVSGMKKCCSSLQVTKLS